MKLFRLFIYMNITRSLAGGSVTCFVELTLRFFVYDNTEIYFNVPRELN
jgi:hypothetical protein